MIKCCETCNEGIRTMLRFECSDGKQTDPKSVCALWKPQETEKDED